MSKEKIIKWSDSKYQMELIFGRNINVFSNLGCHTKVDGVLAEIACLIRSEDLEFYLIETLRGESFAFK